ncbi:MAG TPA: TIGR01777 family oxidoreductase [Solirubrobacteraceae bacterium]|jgi:hypothetical protein|nr:TIGR01777 family oxidoreductase [Solirubrobacteraceae bacterium]
MKVTVTGATGLLGSALVAALRSRGDEVTALSRDPEGAGERLKVPAERWNPLEEPAPTSALAGRDAVVNLLGERVNQRWTERAREAIHASRVAGTRNLVEGLRAAEPRPAALVSGSASGFYGSRGEEPIDEEAAPGLDFLAGVCVEWEAAARAAESLGMRVCLLRTGVVLARGGGALAQMLPPFRLGVGGPIAGGHQFVPWIHHDDVVGIILAALDGGPSWEGPLNASSPDPVTNKEFSHALGRALHRPAIAPVPGFAVRLLYGQMAEIVIGGVRMMPARPLVLGYEFGHLDLDAALRDLLA